MGSLIKDFENAENIKEMFDVVRDAAKLKLNESRAGIDIGLVDLGNTEHELLSAFYTVESNIIVVNKTPITRILTTKPELMKPYMFTVLLHEYIHSLGYLSEEDTRNITYSIAKEIFGEDHPTTQMAKDMRKFFPFLLYPGGHPPSNNMKVIELDEIDYIG